MIDDVAQKKIMEAYEKTVLNEAVGGLEPIVDNFVRYLMGDKKVSLRYLTSLTPPKMAIPNPGEEFNEMWYAMHKAIMKAIQTTVRGK